MPITTSYDTELFHVVRTQYFAQCHKIRTQQYDEFCHNQSLPSAHLPIIDVPPHVTCDFKKYLLLQRDFYTQSFSADLCLLHQILSPVWSAKIRTQCVCGFLFLKFHNTIFNPNKFVDLTYSAYNSDLFYNGMTKEDWWQCLNNFKKKGFLICIIADRIPSKDEEAVFQKFIYIDLRDVIDCVLVSEILLPKWLMFDFFQKFIKSVYGLMYQPFQFILLDDHLININARKYGFHFIHSEAAEQNKAHPFVEFLHSCSEFPLPTSDVRHTLFMDDYAADFLDISVEWWSETKDFRDGFAQRGPSFVEDRLEKSEFERGDLALRTRVVTKSLRIHEQHSRQAIEQMAHTAFSELCVSAKAELSVCRINPLLRALQERNHGYIRKTDSRTREKLIIAVREKIRAITHSDGFEKFALTALEKHRLALYEKELRMLEA